MKKLKPSIQKKLDNIDIQIYNAYSDYEEASKKFARLYNVDVEEPNVDSENYFEFSQWQSDAHREMLYKIATLEADRAALLLIGYNIAHRGKPLHEKTVLAKTQKLGLDGYNIRRQMQKSFALAPTFISSARLHTALKKRGITLLDTNAYRMIINMLCNMDPQSPEQRHMMNHYEKQLNLFHKRIGEKLNTQKTK